MHSRTSIGGKTAHAIKNGVIRQRPCRHSPGHPSAMNVPPSLGRGCTSGARAHVALCKATIPSHSNRILARWKNDFQNILALPLRRTVSTEGINYLNGSSRGSTPQEWAMPSLDTPVVDKGGRSPMGSVGSSMSGTRRRRPSATGLKTKVRTAQSRECTFRSRPSSTRCQPLFFPGILCCPLLAHVCPFFSSPNLERLWTDSLAALLAASNVLARRPQAKGPSAWPDPSEYSGASQALALKIHCTFSNPSTCGIIFIVASKQNSQRRMCAQEP